MKRAWPVRTVATIRPDFLQNFASRCLEFSRIRPGQKVLDPFGGANGKVATAAQWDGIDLNS